MWEYKKYCIDSSCEENMLNLYGNDGWELVSVVIHPVYNGYCFYLKRQKFTKYSNDQLEWLGESGDKNQY